jgi:exopolyphosphatase/pppGpp-phosphohydrolase
MTTTARLETSAQQTRIDFGGGAAAVLPLGAGSLAEAIFRHDPPTAFELEQAIDAVEDALTATRLPHASRGALVTTDSWVRELVGLEAAGTSLTRDGVEGLFQRLVSASQGHTGALAGLPSGGEGAATLLLLRECMHHLGFESVQMVGGV